MGSQPQCGRTWWKKNPRRKLTQGQISFHSLDHNRSGKSSQEHLIPGFTVRVSLPVLPSHPATQPFFPDSCPLERRARTSVCYCFFSYCSKALKLKIEVRTEFCSAWCRGPPSTRLPGCKRQRQGPLCQLCQAPLSARLPAQAWLLAFVLLGEAHPKRSIPLFFCQPSQSSNHLFLSKKMWQPEVG